MTDTRTARDRSGTVAVEGAQLPYVIEGRGYRCLVVGSSRYYRRTFSSQLKQVLQCAFLDHRGFLPAATTGAQEAYTIDLITADIEQVRRALGWDRVVVYGHSIHGLMALEYARHHPAHVSHVVMEGTPAYTGAPFGQAQQALWDAAASAERKALQERNWHGLEERRQGMSARDAFVAAYVANGPQLWADPTHDATPHWDGVDINMALVNQIYGATFGDYDVL